MAIDMTKEDEPFGLTEGQQRELDRRLELSKGKGGPDMG